MMKPVIRWLMLGMLLAGTTPALADGEWEPPVAAKSYVSDLGNPLESLVDEADAIVLLDIEDADYRLTAAGGPMYGTGRVIRVLQGEIRGSSLTFGARASAGSKYRSREHRVLLLKRVPQDHSYYHAARWASIDAGKLEIRFSARAAESCTVESLRLSIRGTGISSRSIPRLHCP